MSRDIDLRDDYISATLPAEIPDDLIEFLPEDDEDLSYEEVIQQQASVYQSYQESREVNNVSEDDDCSGESSCSSEDEDGSLERGVDSQEAMDEAFARSLQDLGEEFDEFFITEFNGSASSSLNEHAHVASPDLSEEDIDTDNMRYEELLNLTETIGVESVGLSAVQISRLPTSLFTAGMFSKDMEENCAICQEKFKFAKRVITLPCCHLYHSKCIITWLKLKKNCPICQKEVA